jgi:hypothetical protein
MKLATYLMVRASVTIQDDTEGSPVDPQRPTPSGGFINHAQDFTLHNPTMTSVQGDQYATYIQADLNLAPQSR